MPYRLLWIKASAKFNLFEIFKTKKCKRKVQYDKVLFTLSSGGALSVHIGQGLTSGKHTCPCYPALAWHDAASGARCPSLRLSG